MGMDLNDACKSISGVVLAKHGTGNDMAGLTQKWHGIFRLHRPGDDAVHQSDSQGGFDTAQEAAILPEVVEVRLWPKSD